MLASVRPTSACGGRRITRSRSLLRFCASKEAVRLHRKHVNRTVPSAHRGTPHYAEAIAATRNSCDGLRVPATRARSTHAGADLPRAVTSHSLELTMSTLPSGSAPPNRRKRGHPTIRAAADSETVALSGARFWRHCSHHGVDPKRSSTQRLEVITAAKLKQWPRSRHDRKTIVAQINERVRCFARFASSF